MPLQQLSASQTNPEVVINENFESLDHQAVYGKNHATTTGLTWGYYGGRWGGFSVSNGTVTLDPSDTVYMVVDVSDGTVSIDTASTDWNDAANYKRVYKFTTGASSVTAVEDHRAGPSGVHGSGTADSDASAVTAISSSSGVVDINCALGDYFTFSLTEAVTSITFSNLPGSGRGASKFIQITQDSTPRTVAWPASFKWVAGVAGAVSTGSAAVDLLAISTLDNGTTWRATLAKAFA